MKRHSQQPSRSPQRGSVSTPEPVEIPYFAADGAPAGSRTFHPGPVKNYPNIALLKEAVRCQQAHLRRGTASTKTRGEITGSNRKPWRQKGTGRARAGVRKSPLWRGGGTVFGPKPRRYTYRMPRRQRRLAARHALLSKLLDREARIIEGLTLDEPSTAALRRILERVGASRSCLIGIGGDLDAARARALVLSARNLERVQVLPISELSPLALLEHRSLVLTESAFEAVQAREQEQSGADPAQRPAAAGEDGEGEA